MIICAWHCDLTFVLYITVLYYIVLRYAVLYCTVLPCTIQYIVACTVLCAI